VSRTFFGWVECVAQAVLPAHAGDEHPAGPRHRHLSHPGTTPPLLIHHVEQFGALHQTVVALAIKFAEVPRIPRRQRLEKELSDDFWQITAHFGFVQVPDLYAALRQAKGSSSEVDLDHAIFFISRDSVVAARVQNILSRARVMLFAFMLRNSVHAVDLFLIPTDQLC
jgi:KUP system potassium uptake protein